LRLLTSTPPSAAESKFLSLYDKQGALHARAEALATSQEKLMKRQAADIDRFENILDTWGKQQAQYQSYLDSLKKQ